ncbi:PLP-dependent aminotransferase family protein [Chitinophaga sp. 212800010-3]|uniref:MocR-like pyridoxine biosynthesis transcription factor PdxR n=1 Tax=unclassified Chitinophaga TaxID=2619133 RepID=UPI002DF51E9D|nr:HTH gntR-type domain-containing protein [Chitinophaga sp. 212800010-3]
MLRPWELNITINHHSGKAVYMQIADAIIAAVKSGKLRSGDALPGSRQLAAQLQLNRNTIVEALDVLLAEGWLESRERLGTFVAEDLPVIKAVKPEQHKPEKNKAAAPKPAVIFDDGQPDSRIAPINELARAYRQIFHRKGRWQMMGYSNETDDPAFRLAIVQMLNYRRGMRLNADDVFITRGSQMAMYLSAHCLLGKGDDVVIEHPGYKPAWQAFEQAGARLLPVGVDKEGLITEELKKYLRRYRSIRAVYITPHHQYPTTVTMSLQRRLELIALSNEYGFTIIEDDYDNEFHFGQRPVLPICSYENLENYIYVGTMSKIVAPALRIGYLASSRGFIGKVGQLRRIIDVQGDNIMEQAILQLVKEGEIKRHLKRATAVYKARRDLFDGLLREHLSGKVNFSRPEGGLAFWLEPNGRTNLVKLAETLQQHGIQVAHPERYSYGEPVNGLRLGYASLGEKQLEAGVKGIGRWL